jgi:hypothetical protein
MPFQGDSELLSEAHWNDTIPYTNNRKPLKKHATFLRLHPKRNRLK